MQSAIKNFFLSKSTKAKKSNKMRVNKEFEAHESLVAPSRVQIHPTAPYHSSKCRPLPKGSRSVHAGASEHDIDHGRTTRGIHRSASNENVWADGAGNRLRSRSEYRERHIDDRNTGDPEASGRDRERRDKSSSHARRQRSPSEGLSDEEEGWHDKMVRLEYENKKLRYMLKKSEGKCSYLSTAKKEVEKAYLTRINQMESARPLENHNREQTYKPVHGFGFAPMCVPNANPAFDHRHPSFAPLPHESFAPPHNPQHYPLDWRMQDHSPSSTPNRCDDPSDQGGLLSNATSDMDESMLLSGNMKMH